MPQVKIGRGFVASGHGRRAGPGGPVEPRGADWRYRAMTRRTHSRVHSFRRAALTFLRVAGTAGVAGYVLTRVSPGDLLTTLRGVHPATLSAAVVLYLLG